MVTDTLVETQIEKGRRLVTDLRRQIDVTAACWIKTNEEGRWFLYIASKAYDEQGPLPAYRQACSVAQALGIPSLSLFELKLVSPANPIVHEVLEFQRRFPASLPTRVRGPQLGNLTIEEAYIYPPQ